MASTGADSLPSISTAAIHTYDQPPDFIENAGGDTDLPAYSEASIIGPSQNSLGRTLPIDAPVEHVNALTDSKGRTWLTTTVKNWAPSPKSVPVLYQRRPIAGEVVLDLDKPEGIKAVCIRVKAQIRFGRTDENEILNICHTIWDTSMGDPRGPREENPSKYTGKLQGNYRWSYSILLPDEIVLDGKKGVYHDLVGTFPIPSSIRERMSHFFLLYDLITIVERSSMFAVSSELTTPFNFTPFIVPEPLSDLRRLSYQENVPLIGPDLDPSGWEVCPTVEIEGKLFDSISVSLNCTLAIAKPLCYTRGTVIPCILTLVCPNSQALDLLSRPDVPLLDLRRKYMVYKRSDVQIASMINVDQITKRLMPLARATWWTARDSEFIGEDTPFKRTLHGELRVPSEIQPGFLLGDFGLKYVLEMYTPRTTGFVSTSKKKKLLKKDVHIATALAPGPRPRSYRPSQISETVLSQTLTLEEQEMLLEDDD